MATHSHLFRGRSFPLGATWTPCGVNFSVFASWARAVQLVLFNERDPENPSQVIDLDPQRNRTFYYWHVFVEDLPPGTMFGWRIDGPYDPSQGHRFDANKLLLDPYARAVVFPPRYSRQAASRPGDNTATALKGVVVDPNAYDWEDDAPLQRPMPGTIIYEMHVRGFTQHPTAGAKHPGSYLGLIEKIPYLQKLGVTAVELLPIQEFDPGDAAPNRRNYWGYSPIGFFAPHRGYCANPNDVMAPVNEFRDMVKALHRAGIEVILDVVFNHTAEGGEGGPTLSFRGLGNRSYYMLDERDHRIYSNYTGCGNTLNSNHSVVRRMILDCLRSWVTEMHVDGFRFDLASVMSRDEEGRPLENPPIVWEIESDPVLAGTKIIAEAWDAAGLYQVGTFIGDRWAEWNGQFRDDVRRFVKGDNDMVARLSQRMIASPDIYSAPRYHERDPNRSVNFVTCHDGFTLNDLVSYNQKHNDDNGENNRDGSDTNWSWNCGAEGPTDDPAIEALRERQIRNMLSILLLSQGTPMLLMGDEVRRTQFGNNNAYCQDNELSWFDWSLLERNAGLLRFVQHLIGFVRKREIFREERFWTVGAIHKRRGVGDELTEPHVRWHGVKLNKPDFGSNSHSLALTLAQPGQPEMMHLMLNAYWEPLEFQLPKLQRGRKWLRVIDTSQPSPQDFAEPAVAAEIANGSQKVEPRSVVLLIG
jgi:glycogen operon protein